MSQHIFEITKAATFDAAHHLPDGPPGPYTRMHGHSFRVEATVAQVMTANVTTVLDTDDLKVALDAMGGGKIRRLPVVDKHDRLVGVVSLGDLSTRVKEKYAGEALETISQPG